MRSKFFSFIALLAIAGAYAEDVDLEKAVGSLIAAEKAYAKLAGEKRFCEGVDLCVRRRCGNLRAQRSQPEKVLAGSEEGSGHNLATALRVDLADR
jgi:hypothetical protein